MYTAAPGKNIESRADSAMTASAFGWPMRGEPGAVDRVDGHVDAGPSPVPTSSPLKSMGASSFSPSPITTVPCIETDVDHEPHRVDGGLVGGDLVAAADPAARRRARRPP